MSVLEAPGARLYYELRGAGPLLVLVPGASGEADSYRNLADELSAPYQVVTYDRRGFSRSQLLGAQDYDQRLATDADDVRRLIKHLGREPAIVIGNSSGALVALEVLIRHPDVLHTVVAHEPPAVALLPDGEAWVAFFEAAYDTYRRSGIHPALAQFGDGIAAGPERAAMARARDPNYSPQVAANILYWFERELRQYTRTEVDLEALAVHADRVVLAGGRDSTKQITYQPNTVLAATIGKTIVDLPGGHVGLITHPPEFARALLDVLDAVGPTGTTGRAAPPPSRQRGAGRDLPA